MNQPNYMCTHIISGVIGWLCNCMLTKYEAFWEDHEQCTDVVKQGWGSGALDQGVWENVIEKSKACKRELMAWNKRTFKNASKEIGKLKRYLTELLNQQSSEVDWGKVKEVREEIHKLWI